MTCIGAYQITSNWTETEITYNSCPSIASEPVSTVSLDVDKLEPYELGINCFDVSELILDWYCDSNTNNGIAIKHESGMIISFAHGSFDANGCSISLSEVETVPDFDTSDIYNFTTDTAQVDLSGCELVIFVACNSGNINVNNLAKAAATAGAKTAIGFNGEPSYLHAIVWVDLFLKYYIQGYTAEEILTIMYPCDNNTNNDNITNLLFESIPKNLVRIEHGG